MIAAITREKKKRGFGSLLNQFDDRRCVTAKAADSAIRQTVGLIERLNAIIVAGATFDVCADDFQITNANCLKDADKDFLAINKSFVLCTLQQGLLMKHLPLDSITDYKVETGERHAIAADGRETSSESYFEIVRDVTVKWFENLIEKL